RAPSAPPGLPPPRPGPLRREASARPPRVQGEHLGEALQQAAVEALGLGDRGRIDAHADAALVAVADKRDHRRAPGQRGARISALGAGSAGLSAARALCLAGRSVEVIERASEWSIEGSGAWALSKRDASSARAGARRRGSRERARGSSWALLRSTGQPARGGGRTAVDRA